MTTNQNPTTNTQADVDDTEGQSFRHGRATESDHTDDTTTADRKTRPEDDDTTGHGFRGSYKKMPADNQTDLDDTEGHGYKSW